jgi:hypothetical protein
LVDVASETSQEILKNSSSIKNFVNMMAVIALSMRGLDQPAPDKDPAINSKLIAATLAPNLSTC